MKTTVALLIIACVAASLLWMFETHPDSEKTGVESDGRILNFTPESVTNLLIRRDDQIMEFSLSNNEWILVSPVRARAKSSDINKILYAMETMIQGETITAKDREHRGITLRDYELETPKMEISVRCSDAKHTLHIGRRAPLGNMIYVRTPPDETVVSVPAGLESIIPDDYNAIRDRKLLKNQLNEIQRLEIRRTGRPTIQLIKKGAEWLIENPVFLRADKDKINRLLNSLFALDIQKFVSDSAGGLIGYGLNEEESPLQITLWTRSKEAGQKISFGKKTDEEPDLVYAGTREGQSVYAVNADIMQLFDTDLAELSAGTLYFMPAEKAGIIRLGCAAKTIEIRRQPENHWRITTPVQCKADEQKVQELILTLNTQPVTAFYDADTNIFAPEIFDKPLYFASMAEYLPAADITSGASPMPVAIQTDAPRLFAIPPPSTTQNRLIGKFTGLNTIYELPQDIIKTLCFDVNYFRDRTILNLDPDGIIKITLDISGIRHVAEWHEEKKAWFLSQPAETAINKDIINLILDSAQEWKALRFLPETREDPASYGLDRPKAVLTLGLTEKNGIQKTIMFGDISDDLGIYAMVQGRDTIFVLDKNTVDSILKGLAR